MLSQMPHIGIASIFLLLSIGVSNSEGPSTNSILPLDETGIFQHNWTTNEDSIANNSINLLEISHRTLTLEKRIRDADPNETAPPDSSENKPTDIKGIVTMVFIALAIFTVLCLSWLCFLKGGGWRKRIFRRRQSDQMWIISSQGETTA